LEIKGERATVGDARRLVPKGLPTIALRFNAGTSVDAIQVPKGRLTPLRSSRRMKERFEFTTDVDLTAFCEAIVNRMVSLFGITFDEAVGRLNRDWKGLNITGDDVIYHETKDYWAKTIYYGKKFD
jgi:hypothetical protein